MKYHADHESALAHRANLLAGYAICQSRRRSGWRVAVGSMQPNRSHRDQWRCYGRATRWHELIEAGDPVLRDAAKTSVKPGLRNANLQMTIVVRRSELFEKD